MSASWYAKQVIKYKDELGQVTARLAKVEQDLLDKEAQVQEAAEDTRRLKTQLEEKVKIVDMQENTIKKLSAEIIKFEEKEAAQEKRMQEAASKSREDTRRLETQLEEKVKIVDKRENTIKKLSAEIIKFEEKEAAQVKRMQEVASRSQEDRRRLETQLEEKVKIVDKHENTIKNLSAEIIKVNKDKDKELREYRDQLRDSKENMKIIEFYKAHLP